MCRTTCESLRRCLPHTVGCRHFATYAPTSTVLINACRHLQRIPRQDSGGRRSTEGLPPVTAAAATRHFVENQPHNCGNSLFILLRPTLSVNMPAVVVALVVVSNKKKLIHLVGARTNTSSCNNVCACMCVCSVNDAAASCPHSQPICPSVQPCVRPPIRTPTSQHDYLTARHCALSACLPSRACLSLVAGGCQLPVASWSCLPMTCIKIALNRCAIYCTSEEAV